MKKLLTICLILALVFAFTGCGKVQTYSVEDFTLNKEDVYLAIGEKQSLVESLTPYNASNKKIEYKSGDEAVATVVNGVVIGKKSGRTQVAAKSLDSKITRMVNVTVYDGVLKVGAYSPSDLGFGSRLFNTISGAVAAASSKGSILVESGTYDEVVNVNKSININGNNATLIGSFIVGYPSFKNDEITGGINGFTIYPSHNLELNVKSGVILGSKIKDFKLENLKIKGNINNRIQKPVSYGGEKPLTSAGISSVANLKRSSIDGLTVSKCEIDSFTYGVSLSPYGNAIKITSNEFSNCDYSVCLNACKNVEIASNNINYSGVLKLIENDNATRNIKLTHNNILTPPNAKTSSDQTLLIDAPQGSLNEKQYLNISTNKFYGRSTNSLTQDELNSLAKKIDVPHKQLVIG